MGFSCANSWCNKEYNNKRSLHLHYQQSPLCNPLSQSFVPVGNAGPFDFDLSEQEQQQCQPWHRFSRWPQCWQWHCSVAPVGSGISGSGGGSSGIGISSGSIGSGGGSSGSGIGRGIDRGSVGGGSSTGGSIINSIGGGGSSVVVVIADPPLDIDSDSDNKFFDALSDSHCVECQIEYLGSQFDHFDLDSESGQSNNESESEDNGLDQFIEQNNVDKIYSPLSTMRSQSITKHKCKSCTKDTNSYLRFYLSPIHKLS